MKRTACMLMIFLLCSGCSIVQNSALQADEDDMLFESAQTIVYDNPIDAYFLPFIESAQAEAARREYQDNYGGVWQEEYENILKWMKEKCIYQKDINRIDAYDEAVGKLIDATRPVLITDWLEDYSKAPDDPDRYSWGNGTRSALNQAQGEIYRDAGMRLIEYYDDYTFMQRDYSELHYEGLQPWNKWDTLLPSTYLEKENPIDLYFEDWDRNMIGGELEHRIAAGAYAVCWKEEMLHAYDLLLEQAHPEVDTPREYIIKSRDGFIDFVEDNAQMEAYAIGSDAFGNEAGEYGEIIGTGSGFPSFVCMSQAEQYRMQTFSLYDLLHGKGIEPEFVFDSDDLSDLRPYMAND